MTEQNAYRLLLVEDDAAQEARLRGALATDAERFRVQSVATLAQARLALEAERPDLIIAAPHLPDGVGLALAATGDGEEAAPLLIATRVGDVRAAVEAIKAGASDYVVTSDEMLGRLPSLAERTIHAWASAAEGRRGPSEARERQSAIPEPDEERGALELNDLVDCKALQALMDEFYRLTYIGVAIIDRHGNILVATGWQDICTHFHRVHPEARQNCVESDLQLSQGVPAGTYKFYHCKNNLWDVATPIIVGGAHVGNLYLGQFFLEDETPDYGVFRQQAQRYGFDEAEYLAALERVPRWSKETVNAVMSFYAKFADLVARLGYSNLRLVRALDEREQLLHSLQVSEEKYRVLLENAGEAVVVAQEGMLKYANVAAEKLSGYTKEELTAKPFAAFIHPDDRAMVEERYIQRVRELGVPDAYSFRIMRKEGETRWVELKVVQIDWLGQTATLNLLNDITERKRAEDALRKSEGRYRLLVENAPLGIIAVDTAGRVMDANPTLLAILGSPSLEETSKINLLTFPPLVAAGVSADFAACLRSGEPFLAEYPYVTKWGKETRLRCHGRAMRDPDGAIIGLQALVEDITAYRRMEEQLLQALKMEAVGRLAGGVAHDFNNLLTVINGYSQMLLGTISADEAAYDDLEQIYRAGKRAADLTRQLLAFSRRQVLEPRVLNLNDVLEGMGALLRRLIGEDIHLETRLVPDLGRVRADPGQIEQVVMNLAVNARDAMPQGGTLTLQTANARLETEQLQHDPEAHPGAYVLLTIRDTGLGMTSEVQEHLFEPFFTTKDVGQGTGLGLSTVYGIIKQSGGMITVHSEVGQGTTFSVYLPAVDAMIPAVVASEALQDLPHGSETLLLVEDNPDVRVLASQMLRGLGYRVIEASHGEEALRLDARQGEPLHLLITDVIMPRMSGVELARRLSQRHPSLAVLYMSGYTANAIVDQDVLGSGAQFIQKPFTLEALAHKVRAALRDRE